MYSLNVPVPGRVAALAADLARELPGAYDRRRGEHTLVVKRLGDDAPPAVLEARARELLADRPPFAVRVDGIDMFEEATTGSSPVIYLSVESPGLFDLHEYLCEYFDPLPEIEGDDYTPHVTLARDCEMAAAERLCERDVEPIEWVVDELSFLDAERSNEVGRVALG
ncbi:2'-5' RNA ligase family protein [Halomicrobium salinisoli]|uniref:2'-5' RNA ligase family protein n=1 Tax=Halomicrobium salinisoli TaxID=2878391 RepID=UPI001CF018C9|nr:2'-5' RNA ligase family protein [Halomicrobium salinisoli]